MRTIPDQIQTPSLPDLSSAEKLKKELEIEHCDLENLQVRNNIIEKIKKKYSNREDQAIMLALFHVLLDSQFYSSFTIIDTELEIINNFSANINNERQEHIFTTELKPVVIFSALICFQRIIMESILTIISAENATTVNNFQQIIDNLTMVLEKNIGVIRNLHDVDAQDIAVFSELLYNKVSDLIIVSKESEVNSGLKHLLIMLNRLDPNQERNVKLFLGSLVKDSYHHHNLDNLELDKYLEYLIQILTNIKDHFLTSAFEKDSNNNPVRIYFEPQGVITDIIDECTSYKDYIPININNIIKIFEYQKEKPGNGNQEISDTFRNLIKEYLNKSILVLDQDINVIVKKMNQDDGFLKFILEKSSPTFIILLDIHYQNRYPQLIKKIREYKPESIVSTLPQQYPVIGNLIIFHDDAIDNLRDILGIKKDQKITIDQIFRIINQSKYSDDPQNNKTMQNTLKNLSTVLLNDKKKVQTNAIYEDLFDNMLSIHKSYRTADDKTKKQFNYLSALSIYSFMSFVAKKTKYGVSQGFKDGDTYGILSKMMNVIDDNKQISSLIKDGNRLLFEEVKDTYTEFVRYIPSDNKELYNNIKKIIIFFSSAYPRHTELTQELINAIAKRKLESGELINLDELVTIFQDIKSSQVDIEREGATHTLFLDQDCQNLFYAAIEECSFYQQYNLPIKNFSQAIIIFKYQSHPNCGSITGVVKEKFSQEIIKYFQNKIGTGFGGELPTFLKTAEENKNFLKFLIESCDDKQLKKLEDIFLDKPHLKKQITTFQQQKIKKLKSGEEHSKITEQGFSIEALEKLFNDDRKQKKSSQQKSTKSKSKTQPQITTNNAKEKSEFSEPSLSPTITSYSVSTSPKLSDEFQENQDSLTESDNFELSSETIMELDNFEIDDDARLINDLKQAKLNLDEQLKRTKQRLINKKKHKRPSEDLSSLTKQITRLEKDIIQQDAEVFKLDIKLKLQNVSKKILKDLSDDCPDIQNLFKAPPLPFAPSVVGIYGSRVYSPVLKILQPQTKFKTEEKKRDWDLYCVNEKLFTTGFFNAEDGAKDFTEKYFNGFEIKKINILPGRSVNFKLRHSLSKTDIDFSIYSTKSAKEMHQWQYNYDRLELDVSQTTPCFTINNNNSGLNQSLDFNQFTNQLLNNFEFDIWQTNDRAKKFLPRILNGSGTLQIPDRVWMALQPILKKEFIDIVKKLSQEQEIKRIDDAEQKLAAIRQQFTREYNVELSSDKDKKASDICKWFDEYGAEIKTPTTTPHSSNISRQLTTTKSHCHN